MKTVKKFTSFEDLKSDENKAVDNKLSLKKHHEFEKVIKTIYLRPVKGPRLTESNCECPHHSC